MMNNVKDFNELLVAKRTVPFAERVGAMKSWADKAIQKVAEKQTINLGQASLKKITAPCQGTVIECVKSLSLISANSR